MNGYSLNENYLDEDSEDFDENPIGSASDLSPGLPSMNASKTHNIPSALTHIII